LSANLASPTKAQAAALSLEGFIRDDLIETGYLIRPDGTVFAKATGYVDITDFPYAALRRAGGMTMTHNHPRGTGPSLADVLCGVDWKMLEVRVVTSKCRYMVEQLDNIARIALVPAYQNEFIRQEPLVNLDVQHCRLHPADFEAELLHRTWTRVSSRLGFGYRREP
jgi:hypothetical protein